MKHFTIRRISFLIVLIHISTSWIRCQETVRNSERFQRRYPRAIKNVAVSKRTNRTVESILQHPLYGKGIAYPPSGQPKRNRANYHAGAGFYKKNNRAQPNYNKAGFGGPALLGNYFAHVMSVSVLGFSKVFYEKYKGGLGGSKATNYYVRYYNKTCNTSAMSSVVDVVVPQNLTTCNDVNICVPKTTPLCMTNGDIYCVIPMTETTICNYKSGSLPCISTTLTGSTMCKQPTDKYCKKFGSTNKYVDIPCLSKIRINGYFNINRISLKNDPMIVDGGSFPSGIASSQEYCVTNIAALMLCAMPYDIYT